MSLSNVSKDFLFSKVSDQYRNHVDYLINEVYQGLAGAGVTLPRPTFHVHFPADS